MNISTITEDERFYGYVVGLYLRARPGAREGAPPNALYADFSYNGTVETYIVPDHELFAKLLIILSKNAFERVNDGSYGIGKVWISKDSGEWSVNLP